MPIYDRAANTASRLIKNFGREVILQRPVTDINGYSKFNPINGKYPDNAMESFTVSVVKTRFDKEWTDQYPVQVGDQLLLMEAGVVYPKNNDEIEGYKVVRVQPLEPADTAILFKVQIRKA